MACLRKIMGVSRVDRVRNTIIREALGLKYDIYESPTSGCDILDMLWEWTLKDFHTYNTQWYSAWWKTKRKASKEVVRWYKEWHQTAEHHIISWNKQNGSSKREIERSHGITQRCWSGHGKMKWMNEAANTTIFVSKILTWKTHSLAECYSIWGLHVIPLPMLRFSRNVVLRDQVSKLKLFKEEKSKEFKLENHMSIK